VVTQRSLKDIARGRIVGAMRFLWDAMPHLLLRFRLRADEINVGAGPRLPVQAYQTCTAVAARELGFEPRASTVGLPNNRVVRQTTRPSSHYNLYN
jgi:hypothetical protein